MANPDKSIDPRIMESAKEEFLSKSYEQVSLRDVCRKAGVTTGALYNRFSNKEELFEALVAPTLALTEKFCADTESNSYSYLDTNELLTIWELTPDTQAGIINMLYDNYDGFRLLLCHAEGSRHANFLHDFTCEATERSYHFIEEAYHRGAASFLIDKEELHMLLTAYWSTMLEPLIHGLSREKALEHSRIVARLFHWADVLGF
ncbi:MAG: TetR/AcrR family transcriptional regulator [Firmicutes bacterium]|nr:TetR/AcrR family transcriptional regulator [Bacillota bacterium]